jgi:hypothetical protein
MRFYRPFFVSLLTVAVWSALLLGWAREARAQSCSPSTASVTNIIGIPQRVSDGQVPLPDHPGNPAIAVNYVNRSDCVNDELLQITVGIAAQSSNSIQVWAGSSDCSQLAARTVATQTCWPVMNPVPATTNPMILTIRARDIAAFINSGTSGTKPSSYTPQSPTVSDLTTCDNAQTQDPASPISLYIFVADTASNVCGKAIAYGMTVDLLAGSASGTPTASAGDGQIYVNIPSTSDPDIKGWNVYTDPPPGGGAAALPDAAPLPICDAAAAADTGAVDTGVVDAGDLDATDEGLEAGTGSSSGGTQTSCTGAPLVDGGSAPSASTDTTCSSAILINGGGTTTTTEAGTTSSGGKVVDIPSKYLGVSVGNTSTKATISGLTNNVTYTVAIAATDAAGNVGPLTVVSGCGVYTTPNPVSDFWTAYVKDGGGAGGGFCQLEAAGAPAGSVALGAMFGAAMIGMLRRRRRS